MKILWYWTLRGATSCASEKPVQMIHNGKKFKSSEEEAIFGVIIDNKLTFDRLISRMCQTRSALSRKSAFIFFNLRRIKTMIKSQFSYCPFIWMFCTRKSNNLINKIHERSFRIVTHDKNGNFEDLLKSNNQITVHQKNLQVLMTKVFKIMALAHQ